MRRLKVRAWFGNLKMEGCSEDSGDGVGYGSRVRDNWCVYRNEPIHRPELTALGLWSDRQSLSGFGFQMNFNSALKILRLPVIFKIFATPAYWNIPSCNNLFVSIAMRILCPRRILRWGAFGE